MIGTIAIVGLGQIGSSLGAAIRRRKLAETVLGIARRGSVRKEAIRLGAVDAASGNLSLLRAANVVVLATPVNHILKSIPQVVKAMKPDALLTDVGSTKHEIFERLQKRKVRYIGGHPMAGSEKAGLEGCDPDLFVGRVYVLISGKHARREDVETMSELTEGLDTLTHWMKSAKKHDELVAVISHLPHLVAYALMEVAGEEALKLAGSSFGDATRVAKSPPDMVLDFLLTNRTALPAVSRAFQRVLGDLTQAVRDGDRKALRTVVERARKSRMK